MPPACLCCALAGVTAAARKVTAVGLRARRGAGCWGPVLCLLVLNTCWARDLAALMVDARFCTPAAEVGRGACSAGMAIGGGRKPDTDTLTGDTTGTLAVAQGVSGGGAVGGGAKEGSSRLIL